VEGEWWVGGRCGWVGACGWVSIHLVDASIVAEELV
jgi:hypothetical protein